MGASFDEVELKWRKKGQRIGNMTPDEIKESLNRRFFAVQEDLRYDYGHNGYTGTLAEKDGVFTTYLPNLTDNELKKLVKWIRNFRKEVIDWKTLLPNESRDYYNDEKLMNTLGKLYHPRWSSNRGLGYGTRNSFDDAWNKLYWRWEVKLKPSDAKLLKKLKDNDLYMRKVLFLALLSDSKWSPAVGVANNNDVYFFGMCSS